MHKRRDKLYFKIYKAIIRLFKWKVHFKYLGEMYPNGSFIISNHDAANAPLSWMLYSDKPIRIVGTEEMCSGYKRLYFYLSDVYFHQKNHWPKWLARFFCIFASPIMYVYYKGMDIVPIRAGMGLKRTIADAYLCLSEFHENLVMFPEDSSKGYEKIIKKLKDGYLMILDYSLKKGYDVPVVITNCKKREVIVDNPIMYSEIKEKYKTKEEISNFILNRLNELRSIEIK